LKGIISFYIIDLFRPTLHYCEDDRTVDKPTTSGSRPNGILGLIKYYLASLFQLLTYAENVALPACAPASRAAID